MIHKLFYGPTEHSKDGVTVFMSMLKRREELQKVDSKSKELIARCKKEPTILDVVSYAYSARSEITSGEWGFDEACLYENLNTWNYTNTQIEDALALLLAEELICTFTWRQRTVFDFSYKNQADFQSMFMKAVETSEIVKNHLVEVQKQIDGYLMKKVKEQKNESLASVLRLLIVLPLPEIGARLELGSVAQFHLKTILGEEWVNNVLELMQNKILLTRLNFLSSNPASEYFIPSYVKSTVSHYIDYANVLLRRKLERHVSRPLFDDKFQISYQHKMGFLKMGLCYRKWTVPKVELTDDFVPTSYLSKILVEQTTESPELITKSYPEDEIWTYYLIGKALIDANQSVFIFSPYTDKTTLTQFVKIIPKDIDVRILTSLTSGKDEKKYLECLREMWGQGYRIELLKVIRENGKVPLHARYVIQDSKFVLKMPGDLKEGFSGKSKAENVEWIPFQDNVVVYNDQYDKFWNLSFDESDFSKEPSPVLAVKFSFTKPELVTTYKVACVDGKTRKEEKTISFSQFSSQP